MTTVAPFQPDWASPPGETIAELLAEHALSRTELAAKMALAPAFLDRLIAGEVPLTADIAGALQHILGVSAKFWTAREQQFREELMRLESSLTTPEWLAKLPWKEMMEFGWIRTAGNDPNSIAAACFRFFGVSSLKEWQERYAQVPAMIGFRRSPTFAAKPEPVSAWLRQGEIVATKARCEDWDAARFRSALVQMRALSRVYAPDKFIPDLTRIAAECGVCIAIVRAPAGCPVSGAARFLSPKLALIQLSFRYLSDDHFWFTLFHEAGHLLLHQHTTLHLEGVTPVSESEEVEANQFAADVLLSAADRISMQSLPLDGRAVIRFATRAGISPGIVVGQMQHSGLITRRQLNDLKRRFQWSSS